MANELQLKRTNPGPHTLQFHIAKLRAHEDVVMELDLGRVETSLAFDVMFEPEYDGMSPDVPKELYNAASVTLFVGDQAQDRPTNYRWQEEVDYHTNRGKTVIAMRKAANAMYLALYAPINLVGVVVNCHIGGEVSDCDDVFHPWRISRMYHVSGENYEVVLEWFEKNRTRMILDSSLLVDREKNQNPLHEVCGSVADPKLAKFYLKHCARFIKPELYDTLDQSPIFKLFMRKDIYATSSPKYFRAMELVDLFIKEAAVSTDAQDKFGNTLVHYAARSHSRDSELLKKLVALGAPVNVRNNEGRTPWDECQLEEHRLLTVDINEVERIIGRAPGASAIPMRSLQLVDVLPPRRGATLKEEMFAPMLVQTDERGMVRDERKPLDDDQLDLLTRMFRELDRNRNGWLSMAELRALYKTFDNFGVVESAAEINKIVAAMGLNNDGMITFDEFCMLILKLNSR